MKAPGTRSDITLGWLEYILNNYENRNKEVGSATVFVKNFKVLDGCKDGDGAVGDIVKLSVQATLTRKEKLSAQATLSRKVNTETTSQDMEYNFVAKLMNSNPLRKHFFHKTGFYIREHLMYTTVIPELNKFQEDRANGAYKIDMPRCIYSKCTENEFVLVLEDLNLAGFSMHTKNNSLDLKEVKLVIDQIARLHAVSYAYDESYNFLKKFPGFCNTDYHRYISYFETPAIIDTLVNILKQMKGIKLIAKRLKDLRQYLIHKTIVLHNDNQTHAVLCLNHADCHTNNILFKKETLQDGSAMSDCIKVLDWQLAQWNTPVYDLQLMINTTTSPEFRKVHLHDLLQYYHSMFREITDKLGTPASHWTYDVFQTEYFNMYFFGLFKSIAINSWQSNSVAKRIKNRERTDIKSSILWKTMMYYVSKLAFNFIFTSPMKTFMKFDLKWRLEPLIDDILSGQDPALTSKIVGSIVEAYEMGLFDEKNTK